MIAHQFPYAKRPAFRGMMGFREFYTGVTAGSGDLVQDLPSANLITSIAVSSQKDDTDDSTIITNVRIGKDNFSTIWRDGSWYNFLMQSFADLDVREEDFTLFATDTNVRNTHLNAIKQVICAVNEIPASDDAAYAYCVAASAVGNGVTIAGRKVTAIA